MKTDITALPPKINNGVLRRLNAQRGQRNGRGGVMLPTY